MRIGLERDMSWVFDLEIRRRQEGEKGDFEAKFRCLL